MQPLFSTHYGRQASQPAGGPAGSTADKPHLTDDDLRRAYAKNALQLRILDLNKQADKESDPLKKLRLQATAHNLNQELGDNWGAVPVEFKIRYHDHMYERRRAEVKNAELEQQLKDMEAKLQYNKGMEDENKRLRYENEQLRARQSRRVVTHAETRIAKDAVALVSSETHASHGTPAVNGKTPSVTPVTTKSAGRSIMGLLVSPVMGFMGGGGSVGAAVAPAAPVAGDGATPGRAAKRARE